MFRSLHMKLTLILLLLITSLMAVVGTFLTLENLLRNELLPQDADDADKQKFNLMNLLRTRKNGGADDAE